MIIADSGFWIALGNRRDRHRERALRAAEKWSNEGFITTWPVLTEVAHLLANRVSVQQASAFIGDVARGACVVFDLPDSAMARIQLLMQRNTNLPMDLADASLVILAEEIDDGRILSTDARDFNGYRRKNRLPFANLLLAE